MFHFDIIADDSTDQSVHCVSDGALCSHGELLIENQTCSLAAHVLMQHTYQPTLNPRRSEYYQTETV